MRSFGFLTLAYARVTYELSFLLTASNRNSFAVRRSHREKLTIEWSAAPTDYQALC